MGEAGKQKATTIQVERVSLLSSAARLLWLTNTPVNNVKRTIALYMIDTCARHTELPPNATLGLLSSLSGLTSEALLAVLGRDDIFGVLRALEPHGKTIVYLNAETLLSRVYSSAGFGAAAHHPAVGSSTPNSDIASSTQVTATHDSTRNVSIAIDTKAQAAGDWRQPAVCGVRFSEPRQLGATSDNRRTALGSICQPVGRADACTTVPSFHSAQKSCPEHADMPPSLSSRCEGPIMGFDIPCGKSAAGLGGVCLSWPAKEQYSIEDVTSISSSAHKMQGPLLPGPLPHKGTPQAQSASTMLTTLPTSTHGCAISMPLQAVMPPGHLHTPLVSSSRQERQTAMKPSAATQVAMLQGTKYQQPSMPAQQQARAASSLHCSQTTIPRFPRDGSGLLARRAMAAAAAVKALGSDSRTPVTVENAPTQTGQRMHSSDYSYAVINIPAAQQAVRAVTAAAGKTIVYASTTAAWPDAATGSDEVKTPISTFEATLQRCDNKGHADSSTATLAQCSSTIVSMPAITPCQSLPNFSTPDLSSGPREGDTAYKEHATTAGATRQPAELSAGDDLSGFDQESKPAVGKLPPVQVTPTKLAVEQHTRSIQVNDQ